ncbi:hypothetical protein C3747_23g326 [Trypanosoma cruzi]|uniref:Uncharacterized protein n=2 Tax=Trypanosoma cruzi TaxID=5693 RepID=Q4CMT0_TRYCC|nr:hypothetical protein, conserved [Trypanosoma cruzi]EAN81581.1 hypothetical protein, conserved [Trypanosoma cruzi]PWV16385.1 hypothetical protein C3747_23g326 [Trypanosoma cruzi]RNC47071.1 hypothetical protein TcCL_NonESM03079 [Trypanosoma cruzi]|eukprot:XP_803027.1 hypothetical protein [Trypanosoma cruzi strain CL Brener]
MNACKMMMMIMMWRRTCLVSPAVGVGVHRLSFLSIPQSAKRSYTTSNQKNEDRVSDASTEPPVTSSPSASVDNESAPAASFETSTKESSTSIKKGEVQTDVEPLRWVQDSRDDPLTEPIFDEKGQFIVSRVQWPTGEIAYTTPPPPDGKLAPRFGYNIVQVKKDVSWWKHYQKYPRFSIAYVNIHVLFLLGAAWLAAFLTDEYRKTMEEMRTPGAMVGEQRGRGSVNRQSQKVAFTPGEMTEIIGRAQNNWLDAKTEANYIGSKDYNMKKIPRPKEFSMEDFRKR